MRRLWVKLMLYKINYPMSRYKCSVKSSPALLRFTSGYPTGQRRGMMDVVLCGKRDLYTLMWRENRVDIVHESVLGQDHNISFTLLYQVCGFLCSQQHTTIIYQPYISDIEMGSIRPITYLPNLVKVPRIEGSYSLHIIIGDRLSRLLLLLTLGSTSSLFKMFDGPGPRDVHNIESQNGSWTRCNTFQSFVQIKCQIEECKSVGLSYTSNKDLRRHHHYSVNYIKELNLDLSGHGNLYYLPYYIFPENSASHVQVDYVEVNFHGPDYPDNYENAENCLLGGVVVMDAYRSHLLQYPRSTFFGDENMSLDLLMDNILPILTTCSEVLYIGANGSFHRQLPLTRFVSTTDSIYLLVYAYGGYVDLSKSTVRLHFTETPCFGVIITCLRPFGDGFFQLNLNEFHKTSHRWLDRETSACPATSALLYSLYSSMTGSLEEIFFFINILYCRIANNKVSVHLMDYLSDDVSFGNMCIDIQTNPYQNDNEDIEMCLFINLLGLKHKETLDIQLTASVFCSSVSGDVLHFYGEEKRDVSSQQVTGTGGMNINYNPLCIDFQLAVTVECVGFIEVSPDIDMLSLFGSNEVHPSLCPHNSMSHKKESANVISIVPQLVLNYVYFYLSRDLHVEGLESQLFNAALGNGLIKMTVGYGEGCPVSCRRLQLSVSFKDYTGNISQALVLIWNLHFGQYDTWEYNLLHIPFDDFFVKIERKLPETEECGPIETIHYSKCKLSMTLRRPSEGNYRAQ